jgi:hypothetical protein
MPPTSEFRQQGTREAKWEQQGFLRSGWDDCTKYCQATLTERRYRYWWLLSYITVRLISKRWWAGIRQPRAHERIFRIAYLSELVTAVAAMVLVEDCRIRLRRLDRAVAAGVGQQARAQIDRSATG